MKVHLEIPRVYIAGTTESTWTFQLHYSSMETIFTSCRFLGVNQSLISHINGSAFAL